MTLLNSTRLNISEIKRSDAPFILELLNSPNWLTFIGDRGVNTQKDAIEYIEKRLTNSYKQNGFGFYKLTLKESLTSIGICGFVQRDYLDHPDIGFAILPNHEGKGYSYEACHAVMNYGIKILGLKTILGITTDENIKSQNLLRKIGLSELGRIRNEGVSFKLYST